MKNYVTRCLFALFIVVFGSLGASCVSRNSDGLSVPTPSLTTDFLSSSSFLEKRAEDLGIFKDKNGHLLVAVPGSSVDDEVRFLRLLAYFNAEAKTAGKLQYYPYKVSGAYKKEVSLGYNDNFHFEIQFGSDDFEVPVDIKNLVLNLGLTFTAQGHPLATKGTTYEKLDALLTYWNAKAANEGRNYKLKAQYVSKETKEGELHSDRVDVMVQFSFDLPQENMSSESILMARQSSPLSNVWKEMVANAAVSLSQLTEKPEMITITVADFVGSAPHFPEITYVFDAKAVAMLKQVFAGKEGLSRDHIVALAEVKERMGQLPELKGLIQRQEEPFDAEESAIIARIAEEALRVMRPSQGALLIIYDFRGRAPHAMTTWAYMFPPGAIETILKQERLTYQQILQYAQVLEYSGFIPGNRVVPPVKKVLPSSP